MTHKPLNTLTSADSGQKPLLIITGPTASGKTGRAVAMANRLGGEIISADSRQIYCGMDLGTGKDLDEYGSVPYHLIDIAPAGYRYNLFEYLRDFETALANIRARNAVPVVCGGTGLYVESIAKGVSLPQVPCNEELRQSLAGKSLTELAAILASMKTLHNTTDIDSAQRAIRAIEIQTFYAQNPLLAVDGAPACHPRRCVIVAVDIDRDSRRRRISQRLQQRLDAGMVDEVRRLLDSGVHPDNLIYYGLEYKFLTQYVIGQMSYDEMVQGLETAIHQFAKRQMTWFRGMERRGFTLHWLPYDMPQDEFCDAVSQLLEQ